MAGQESAHPVVADPKQFGFSNPSGAHLGGFGHLADGVRLQIHVLSGVGKDGGKGVAGGNIDTLIQQGTYPMKITQIAPAGVKKNLAFSNDFTAQENGAGQYGESKPHGLPVGNQRMPVAHVFAFAVGDNAASQKDFDLRMIGKKVVNALETAGQILFVAVQVRQDVAGGAAVTAVDGVVHAGIFFDEGFDPLIIGEPLLSAVIRAGVLNDMLEVDAFLIGDRGDAHFEPGGIAETGCDNGKLHRGMISNLWARWRGERKYEL